MKAKSLYTLVALGGGEKIMWIIIFIIGVICGVFYMALAVASKDEKDNPFTEEDEKEIIEYIDKKYKSSTKNDDASS